MRPTLDDIFAEEDAFGLLHVKPSAAIGGSPDRANEAILREIEGFYRRHSRLPNPEAAAHDEMRLGVIFLKMAKSPSPSLLEMDRLGLLSGAMANAPDVSWRDQPRAEELPASLEDIFADDDLSAPPEMFDLRHVTPSAERHTPDHRADFVPCSDFAHFEPRFLEMQHELEEGDRVATAIEKRMVIEPYEGDFFIRNGLLAFIAEKSEMTARGGSRDYRLRVIFSNGTESDPLASSFRKSLNDDKTARVIQRNGLGPLDPEWQADKLAMSGTIYVARSLSSDPAIRAERNILHKIGVTSQDVRRRIADARNDPTFLLAPVEVVATYALLNLPRERVEELLHRFFESARPAKLFIVDRFGKRVNPREWFYVLPDHVGQAAALLKEGRLHLYQYDREQQKIVEKDSSL